MPEIGPERTLVFTLIYIEPANGSFLYQGLQGGEQPLAYSGEAARGRVAGGQGMAARFGPTFFLIWRLFEPPLIRLILAVFVFLSFILMSAR